MAKIRLDDDYINHPKFTLLSDQAFRLWHEGMCYCRKLMTDGLITRGDLKVFKYATPAKVRELTTRRGQSSPLWVEDPEGYRVHDYLDWNPSQAEEQREREATKLRVRAFRGKQGLPLSNGVRNALSNGSSNGDVPGEGKGKGSSEKRSSETPLAVAQNVESLDLRAGHLVERYAELFYLHRHGARYHSRIHLDFMKAQDLVRTWTDDARLEKLAVIILETDDDWVSKTDRGFAVFAAKATWADDRLKAWEREHDVVA